LKKDKYALERVQRDVLPGGYAVVIHNVPVSPVCSVHLVSNHLNSDEKLPYLLYDVGL